MARESPTVPAPPGNSPVNLYLDQSLVEIAKEHVKGNRKVKSLSALVEMLLARELRMKGKRLPAKFVTRAD